MKGMTDFDCTRLQLRFDNKTNNVLGENYLSDSRGEQAN